MTRTRGGWTVAVTVVVAVAAVLGLTACTTPQAAAPAPTSPPSTTLPTVTTPATSAPSVVPTAPAEAPSSTPPAAGPPVVPAVPELLCAAAEQPRDVADTYTGALSAGVVDQAQACVAPGTVPAATTAGLVVAQGQTAAYLLDEAASSGEVFVYRGPPGVLSVTVTTQPDGVPRVSAVALG